MKIQSTLCIALTALFASTAMAADHSGQASGHASHSGSHASASAGHSVAASGQVTSAASAIPLSVGGAALSVGGAVSMGAAHDSVRAAASPIGKPLAITDEIITVTPPNEALKRKDTASEKKSDKPI
ncbi:MAG: hypothetical protein M0P59_12225 [Gallionella sp.]|jgi:hypothetical protein|nr:hypothetical protein [Gallionella sp.]MCK9354911.1 hypothetical protein [Gallionella sp.]